MAALTLQMCWLSWGPMPGFTLTLRVTGQRWLCWEEPWSAATLAAHLGSIEEEGNKKEARSAERCKNQQQKCKEIKSHPRDNSGCLGICFPTSGALHRQLSSSWVTAGAIATSYPSGVRLWLFMSPNPRPGTCLLCILVHHIHRKFRVSWEKQAQCWGIICICSELLPTLTEDAPHIRSSPRNIRAAHRLQAGNQCKPPPSPTCSGFPAKAQPPQQHPQVEMVLVMGGTHPCITGGCSGTRDTPRPGEPGRSSKALSTTVIFPFTLENIFN